MDFLRKCRFLNGNTMKIIACVFMVIDHIGYIFFPTQMIWRYLGRISMPLFAFMIAEGCRYTKNRARYFCILSVLGITFQLVYYLFTKDTFFNIFITFALSVLMVFALQDMKKQLFSKDSRWIIKILSIFAFLGAVALVWGVCKIGERTNLYIVDYGFWGCLLPVFASLLDFHRISLPEKISFFQKADLLWVRVLCFGVGLLFFYLYTPYQSLMQYVFLSLPFLLLYNGTRGKYNIKYFFYIFYPTHLILLQGLATLLQK